VDWQRQEEVEVDGNSSKLSPNSTTHTHINRSMQFPCSLQCRLYDCKLTSISLMYIFYFRPILLLSLFLTERLLLIYSPSTFLSFSSCNISQLPLQIQITLQAYIYIQHLENFCKSVCRSIKYYCCQIKKDEMGGECSM
jgi:hypothetical protein